jgi:hypothetical protein
MTIGRAQNGAQTLAFSGPISTRASPAKGFEGFEGDPFGGVTCGFEGVEAIEGVSAGWSPISKRASWFWFIGNRALNPFDPFDPFERST